VDRLYGLRTALWFCRKVLRSWSSELARQFYSLVVKLYGLRGVGFSAVWLGFSAVWLAVWKKGLDLRLKIWYNALRFGRKLNFRKAEKPQSSLIV